jgi:hypothetical protein
MFRDRLPEHSVQKTTELQYVLRNNSLKLRKYLRFQKYNSNFRFFLSSFDNFSFFQKNDKSFKEIS